MKKSRMLKVVAISALVSLGTLGTLTACGGGDGPAVVTKYKVTVMESADYTVSGLVKDGYEEGAKVEFTVKVNNQDKVLESVKKGTEVLTEKDGKYSFTMGKEEVTITITLKDAVKTNLTVDVTEITLNELGASQVIKATVTGSTEKVTWTSTDEANEIILIEVSEDGLSCKVTNIGGGAAVVTATLGDISRDISVKGSYYGDQRKVYSVYKQDGSLVGDYKGLWNAISKLQDVTKPELVGGYVTEKDKTDKIFDRDPAWIKAIGKNGYTEEQKTFTPKAGLDKWNEERTKASGWYANYQFDVDVHKEFNTLFTLEKDPTHAEFNSIESRAVNFDADLFLDKTFGYNGDPTTNVWSGYRNASYLASVTTAQYISWADASTWKQIDMTWDLSKSKMAPSYNEDQGVFGQVYLGSATRIPYLTGMYFDAGTMAECLKLEDGAEKDIYTFTENLNQSGGLNVGTFGERTIGETSIGKAKWDAFNKVWTFPQVKVNITCDIFFKGEDESNLEAAYHRDYTITGFKGETKVAEVKNSIAHTADLSDATHTRAGSTERTIYGVSLTPNYDKFEVPDITCGASWSNVIQDTSVVYHLDANEAPKNIQFVAGRTVNGGNQTGLIGCDSLTLRSDAEERSIYDFKY